MKPIQTLWSKIEANERDERPDKGDNFKISSFVPYFRFSFVTNMIRNKWLSTFLESEVWRLSFWPQESENKEVEYIRTAKLKCTDLVTLLQNGSKLEILFGLKFEKWYLVLTNRPSEVPVALFPLDLS